MSALQPTLFQWQEDSKINPSPDFREPAVWLRRLIILKQWALGEELCDLEFKKGLNIVWAEPHVPEIVEEGQNGLSGHAAGKTTLCRFIRYALGESTYGTETFREAFRHKFPKGWLLSEVVVNGKEWLVRRPLGIGAHPAAREGDSIERAFAADLEWARFDDYLDALNQAAINTLDVQFFPDSSRNMTWELVLAWLSRDQDCRMGHLAEWRSRTSDSGTPVMSRKEAYWVIKNILGIVSRDDLVAASKQERLRKKQAGLQNEIPMQRYNLEQNCKRLRDILAKVKSQPPISPDLPTKLEFDRIRKELQSKIEHVESELNLVTIPSNINKAEADYQETRKAADILEEDLRQEKNKLLRDEHLLEELSGERKTAEIEAWKRERPAPNDRCNVLLSVAKAEGCPIAHGIPVDMESHLALKSLPERIEVIQKAISDLRKYISNREQELHRRREAVHATRQRLEKLHQQWNRKNIEISQRKSNFAHILEHMNYCEDIANFLDGYEKELERTGKLLNKLADERVEYRKGMVKQKSELESRFCSILQSIFGIAATGRIFLEADSIVPKVECQGVERGSAAMETAKIWAFDLAALLLGVEGKCPHPRFLLHDSPREADLSVDVYHRFFLLLKRAEEACGNSPNFQYIVTTTEQPPGILVESGCLRKHLDASITSGRLLGVNL